MNSSVMDVPGLARYLKLAPVTVYKLVREKKIPVCHVGKSLRFPKEIIDRWLHTRESESRNLPAQVKKTLVLFSEKVRRKLKNKIRNIRLYGSFARGEGRIDSDIDVAVIVDQKEISLVREISRLASEVSLQTNQFLSVQVVEENTHTRGVAEGYPFHLKIEQEGLSF